ncbi:peptidoglycan DD-metalloendopeptidase family protein [Parasphingorhabdus sp.]|uniref:peptidoglycan DD-metalloendopeptidase family protein n=1 Tax=Parasphingorhabdus sp. TaxID=2709688 RepID=UPI003D298851
MRFQRPVGDQFPIIEKFGYYGDGQDPNFTVPTKHRGIDLDTGIGDPVKPTADGTIIYIGDQGTAGYGLYVVVQHLNYDGSPNGIYSLYAHLSALVPQGLKIDDPVSANSPIAVSGNSGLFIPGSGGDGGHLHFEVWYGQDLAEIFESGNISPAFDNKYKVQIGSFGNDVGIARYDGSSSLYPLDNHGAIQGDVFDKNNGTDDTIFGLSGDDTIYGGKGNDIIAGGTGNDAIIGGPPHEDEGDSDTALYWGNISEYHVTKVGETVYVAHLEGDDGTDILTSIELIKFADREVDVSSIPDGGGVISGEYVDNTYDPLLEETEIESDGSSSVFSIAISTFLPAWETFTGSIEQFFSERAELEVGGGERLTAIIGNERVTISDTYSEIELVGIGSIARAELLQGGGWDDFGDTPGEAGAAITSFVAGKIELANDVDVHAVNLTGGTTYAVSLQSVDTRISNGLDPYLRIIDAGGSSLKENDDVVAGSVSAFISFTPNSSGTYYLQASGFGESTGGYNLVFSAIDDSEADNLGPTTGITDDGSDEDWDWQGTDGDDRPSRLTLEAGGAPSVDSDNKYRGHDGDDRIEAGRGDDIVWGDRGEDRLYGEDGNDILRGGRNNDRLYGGDDDDLIYGEDGNDRIYGDTSSSTDSGDDTIYGGDGEDKITAGRGDDYVKGEDDNDDINGNDGDDELYGDRGDDEIDGDDGNDLIFGGRGNDHLEGDDGDDRVAGEDGDDRVEGNDGNDRLFGGDDDDVLIGGEGDDLIHGEDGNDTADFSDGRDGIIANLFEETSISNDLGVDILYGIENITGSDGDDKIDGNHGVNILSGGDGDDLIRGHNGDDTIYGGDEDDVVWGDEGNDTVHGGTDNDEVRGGLGDDTLFGDGGDDHIRGEQGNDTIDGGTGDDTVFFWGEREDFSVVQNSDQSISVTDLRSDGLEGTDTLRNVEFIEFFDGKASVSDFVASGPVAEPDSASSAGSGPVVINALSNDSSGASSARVVSASIVNGAGEVVVMGGQVIYNPGDNYSGLKPWESEQVELSYTIRSAGLVETMGSIDVTVFGPDAPYSEIALSRGGPFGIAPEQMVAGGSYNVSFFVSNTGPDNAGLAADFQILLSRDQSLSSDDIVVGGGLSNGTSLEVSTGNVYLLGLDLPHNIELGEYRLGVVIDYEDPNQANNVLWVPNFETGGVVDVVNGDASTSIIDISGMPTDNPLVLASPLGSVITGNKLTNWLQGLEGNDQINGGAGGDVMDGGDGTDTLSYEGSSLGVFVRLFNNSVFGGDANGDTIVNFENVIGSSNNDDIIGSNQANMLDGGAGNDTINGFVGDDLIIGGAGGDNLDGGDGIDTVSYAESASSLGVFARLFNNSVFGGDANGDTIANFENVIGSSNNDDIIGSNQANMLDGGDGDDTINGFVGDDIIIGGAGGDNLDGGDGIDTLSYAGSASSLGVFVRLFNNSVFGGDANGDTIANFENATGSSNNDDLIGSLGANTLDGGAGNDKLNGYIGDDILIGGAGNDLVIGGAGGDNLDGGADIDTVSYAGSTLGVFVRLFNNSVFGGDANGDTIVNFENATGSSNNDDLIGSNQANTLDGGAGADKLNGFVGDDILIGGAGDDLFVFTGTSGSDTITDFTAGAGSEDKIDLQDSVFTDLNDVLANTNDDGLGNTVISKSGVSITLNGVTKNQLDDSDFVLPGSGPASRLTANGATESDAQIIGAAFESGIGQMMPDDLFLMADHHAYLGFDADSHWIV